MALAMAGLCFDASAGEKIEIVGDGVQLPKKRTLFEERTSSFDVLTDKPDLSGGFAPPPVVVPESAARELLQEYDRRKNWIFADPRELDKRATGLDKLQRKESANPLEPKSEQQSVLERFLTERERRLKENRELSRDNNGLDRKDQAREGLLNSFSRDEGFSRFDPLDEEDREFARELSLDSFLNRGETATQQSQVTDPYSRQYFNFATPGQPQATAEQQQLDVEKQEELRSATFQRLLQPRSITPSIAGVVDPIRGETDPSREAANPIAPRRPDPLNFGRPGGNEDSYGSPAFTANAARTGLPDLNRSLGLESPDIRGAQSGVLMSQPSALPAPQSPAPAVNSSAFSFEIPKRKF